jgi:dishevelled associated activator of morphogenesis
MEKDAHKMSAEKMRQQLEAKVHEGMTLKDKQLELEGQIAKMTRQNDELKAHCDNLQDRLKEKNVDISDLPKYTPPPPAPPPPAPPPPLPSYIAPPPPPPPLPGGNSDATVIQSGLVTIRRRPKKSIPKLTNPLKSLNWEKMNDMQIGENTIWAGIDETPIYKEINLDDFQKTFTQRPMSSDYGTLSKTSRNKRTSREKLFIDSKRAQNCSILLTRLKLSNEQIRQAVMTMDPNDTLDKDMVEQLLKFIPSKEEYELLKANLSEMDNFSRADRFMLEMSHVPRYEKRLNALYFTKNFHERISEIHPNIESVTASCHELMMSEKLRKLLEIILAFGNIMNRGNRGNAFGFKLSSLNKITDTKSSTDNEMTLLHYLIQMLEAKFPEVVTLEVDLPHISEASKVDIGELEKEFKAIRKELKLLKEELDFHRLNPSGEESDRFVSAVEDFAFRADIDVKETEHFMKDMKEQFHKALRYFGEDPKAKDQTAFKFFGVFTKFLHSLSVK